MVYPLENSEDKQRIQRTFILAQEPLYYLALVILGDWLSYSGVHTDYQNAGLLEPNPQTPTFFIIFFTEIFLSLLKKPKMFLKRLTV